MGEDDEQVIARAEASMLALPAATLFSGAHSSTQLAPLSVNSETGALGGPSQDARAQRKRRWSGVLTALS